MKQKKYQLKNGLKVLLIESKKSPVISVQMWVKTGSADEKKSEEGISHFIEHLVFKGTEKYKVGEIANTVEAAGGELNAYTSFDQTVFYVTISKNFGETALDVISQMMGYPTFDPKEVDSEREVVCEEIKMGQDSPNRKAMQLMFAEAFKKHAYGIPVIGYDKNVRKWPAKKIKEYYQSRYVPSNMFLVVSGDFEISEMKQKVEKYFSGFKSYKLKKSVRSKEPKQKKLSYKFLNYKIQDIHLNFAFKAPSIKHSDVPALDVLAMVLGQGDSSLLVKKLRLEKPLVNGVSAFNYNPQDAGLFVISTQFQDEKRFNEISDEILKQIKTLQNIDVSWSEIKRARIAISSEQFYSVETVEGIANKAGTLEFYFNDQNAQKKYLRQLNKITPKEVRQAAKKYLKADQLSITMMGNVDEKLAKKQLASVEKSWKKMGATFESPAVTSKKIKIPNLVLKPTQISKTPEVEKIILNSGIKLLMMPVKDIPTVSAKIVFRGGARLENQDTMGAAELAARSWVSSTKSLSEEKLLQEIEESAIGLSTFSGKNTSGLSLDYLSVFEEKSLSLMNDVILNSLFEEKIINREKAILFQTVKSKEDSPASVCVRQFLRSMYGNHPLAYETTGTEKTLIALKRKDIVELVQKMLFHKNTTITVVGDYKESLWIKKIEELEKNFSKTISANLEHRLEPLTENKREFTEKIKEQSHVMIGWRGLNLTDPDRYTLEIIEAVLSGQGGRLFYELRDKNSLAYSVSPMKMESLETGYFGGYIACSHDKVEKSIEMFKNEFNKLMREKITQEELERAQKYLVGQHDIGLQKKSAICNLITFDEVYGNDYKQSLDVSKMYLKVDQEKIIKLANKLFSAPSVISVVGQKSV